MEGKGERFREIFVIGDGEGTLGGLRGRRRARLCHFGTGRLRFRLRLGPSGPRWDASCAHRQGDMAGKEKSREIRQLIRGILMEEWDPIGAANIPEAADEYDSYIGGKAVAVSLKGLWRYYVESAE